jgi:hypothetical protein
MHRLPTTEQQQAGCARPALNHTTPHPSTSFIWKHPHPTPQHPTHSSACCTGMPQPAAGRSPMLLLLLCRCMHVRQQACSKAPTANPGADQTQLSLCMGDCMRMSGQVKVVGQLQPATTAGGGRRTPPLTGCLLHRCKAPAAVSRRVGSHHVWWTGYKCATGHSICVHDTTHTLHARCPTEVYPQDQPPTDTTKHKAHTHLCLMLVH